MRRRGPILLVVVLLAGGGIAWGWLRLNRLLEENRGWIDERAESLVGRTVSFGEASLSLWGGPGVRITDLRVADDPAFSEADFARVASVGVRLALLPALRGRLEIREIVLEDPQVVVIRAAEGFNFESIGPRAATPAPGRAATGAPGPGSGGGAPRGRALVVALVTVRDGTVAFLDRTRSPATAATLQRVGARVSGIGAARPARVEISASSSGREEPNLRLTGEVGPIGAEHVLAPETLPLDLSLETRRVVLDALRAFPHGDAIPRALSAPGSATVRVHARGPVAALALEAELDATATEVRWDDDFAKPRGEPLRVRAAGVVSSERIDVESMSIRLSSMSISGSAVVRPGPPLTADVRLGADEADVSDLATVLPAFAESSSDPEDDVPADPWRDVQVRSHFAHVRGRDLLRTDLRAAAGSAFGVPFDDLSAEVAVTGNVAELRSLEAGVLGGTCRSRGRVDFREPDRPAFELALRVRDVDVGELIERRSAEPDVRMTGRLHGRLELAGAGRDGAEIRRTLGGRGHAEVRDGLLIGVNLPERILEGLTGVSGLTRLLSDDLRDKYAHVFGVQETPFREVSASFDVAQGRVVTEDALVAARDFTLEGEGTVGLDGEVDLDAVFLASEPLTADVVAHLPEARFVTGEDGRIEVPVQLSGDLSRLRVRPDVEFVATAVARGTLGDGAADLIEEGLRGLLGR